MAWLCSRTIFQTCRRQFYRDAVRYTKEKKDTFPDPLELATGLEKRELLAAAAGDFDPYHMKAIEILRDSTKENPNLVPSAFKSRVVGCLCEEDTAHVNWMWLHEGQPRRCECGHWFKLTEVAPLG
ncbi:cytochrome c oxidase subunit 5B, mitochondrial-like [Bombus vosnesenskii]|uniref:Cytochrome c oxidase subunit 5B, mitochondrial-like n=3 Tax=Pyrobombus TaxID=144703 RepID=A0A6J3KKA9_9HYME|nr:cytochrome c oxidase subunit 5B, mitochondrial [Bombus impatiens]XP_033184405.1 cytochrome c oxidase subunit 5B, mitochondrial-like [Bombus vancouverensis nearcticus]XP_033304871.1 cytochrome c oxidase subunit 5B, mitochondrial-like [Bombus bifarius]XP_033353390.1 cytochrome c oxidase subunit 5B, mitochondrial-like [Bombus vosnesenskii]XP_050472320.1 cytochrome c oxidase subunit 5B, mitochondrial-like [Bombus huntii]